MIQEPEPTHTSTHVYLIFTALLLLPLASLSLSSPFLLALLASQIFQNFKFSSLAAVATVHPSGLIELQRTRASCAGTS